VIPCSLEHFLTAIDEKAADFHPVLIFDQFEELFTLFGQSKDKAPIAEQTLQDHIVDTIFRIVKSVVLKAKVMIIIREDFLGKLEILTKNYPQLFDQRVRLGHLDEIQSRKAILGPFAKENPFASQLTPELAERIIKDLSSDQPTVQIQPTQLQIICSRLWEKYASTKSEITVEDYIGLGGVKGILEGFLQSELTAIEPIQRSQAVMILGNLITESGTRDVVSVDKLRGLITAKTDIDQDGISPTLRLLEERRLVNRTHQRGTDYYEIASEYLIQPIQKEVREQRELALRQERAEAEKQAAIEAAAREREAALQRETAQAQQRAEEKAEDARRLLRLTRWLKVVSVVAVVAAIIAGVLGWRARDRAEEAEVARDDANKERRLATSRRLAAVAQNRLVTDPQLSILLALHAVFETYSVDEPVTAEVQDSLHRAVQTSQAGLRLSHTLAISTRSVNSIAFSPDGRYLATASQDGTARVWDAAFGQLKFTLSGHLGAVTSVAFSPDGRVLATTSRDRTAKVWNTASGQAILTISGHTRLITSVAFSSDGRYLATASLDSTARVWEVASGQVVSVLLGHSRPVNHVAFSPDGRLLATASQDGTARVWDAASGRETAILGERTDFEYNNAINSVAFSPNGRQLATASADRTAKVWDVASRRVLYTIPERTGAINSIAFSPDGRYLATAGEDLITEMWEIVSGYAGAVDSIALSRNGQLLATANSDGTVEVWDTTIDQVVHTLLGSTPPLISMAFSSDGGRLTTVSRDGALQVWDVASGQAVLPLLRSTAPVISTAFSSNGGRLATASRDGAVRVWDVASGQIILPILGSTLSVINMAFGPEGARLATVSRDGAVQVWDVASGQAVPDLLRTIERSASITFSPDGKQLAIAGRDGAVRLWDFISTKVQDFPSRDTVPITALAFCPDGTCLTTVSQNGTVKVWDTTSHKPKLSLSGDDALVTAIAFGLEGNRLATVSQDRKVRVYTLDLNDLVHQALTQMARPLTTEECQDHLDADANQCPPAAQALASVVAGKNAASSSKVGAALESFRQAKALHSSLPLDAEAEAGRLAARPLIAQGRRLARTGEVKAARESLGKARELYPGLSLDLEVQMGRLAAPVIVEQGRRLVTREGKVKEAIAAYAEAQRLDPTLQIPALAWNTLCWQGSLRGYAKDVLEACEQAVKMEPQSPNFRDSRGVARAMTGDRQGAIEDFEEYIKNPDNDELKLQRQRWVASLRSGKNPFTAKEIKTLFNQ
jgi:WD40 repeat protein